MECHTPIIRLANVAFRYAQTREDVLDNLSLEIPFHTITALLGPNGSGKTTLLHLLVGLLQPQRGQIHVVNKEQQTYNRREYSRLVGLVPQDETIPFELRVTEYVLLGRAPHLHPLEPPDAEDYAIGRKALQTVGLIALQDRSMTTLSGGERRLAMIARALAQRPRLLLMDEPTTHLDLGNRSRLLGLMQALVAQDVTIVFSTHDPNAAAACAGHIVLLDQGKVLATGSPSTVLTPSLLSRLYDVNVDVAEVKGRPVVTVNGFTEPVTK